VSPRRPDAAAVQLPLVAAAEVEPASGSCQRWSGGSHRWRRRRDGGFDRTPLPDGAHRQRRGQAGGGTRALPAHLSAARLSWGLYEGHQLLGVAMFGVPSHPAVVRNVFPDLQPSLNRWGPSTYRCRFRSRSPVDLLWSGGIDPLETSAGSGGRRHENPRRDQAGVPFNDPSGHVTRPGISATSLAVQ
jgi:hypothetical protein